MFGLYFCYYLLEKNKISQSEFDELVLQLHNTRAKLGAIAVAEKLLTTKQAEEINEYQKTMNQRFGDIAIEKGYLLEEEVTYLLRRQENTYIKLVQLLLEKHKFTMHLIKELLEQYKTEEKLSDDEIDSLLSDDVDSIISVFIESNAPYLGDCASLLIRNIIRFVNHEIILQKAYLSKNYSSTVMVCQRIIGEKNISVGLAGEESALLAIAGPYAKQQYCSFNQEVIHSLYDFMNCSNRLYASTLNSKGIQMELTPPEYYCNLSLVASEAIYIIPFSIQKKRIDLIVTAGDLIIEQQQDLCTS
jgi:CheY-specific phosphatase CheX